MRFRTVLARWAPGAPEVGSHFDVVPAEAEQWSKENLGELLVDWLGDELPTNGNNSTNSIFLSWIIG